MRRRAIQRHAGFDSATGGLAAAALTLLVSFPAWADEAPRRFELTVFAGGSVRAFERAGAPRFPRVLPAIYTFGTRVDRAALFGVRLTRYLGERAALEVDLSLAPSQDAEFRAEVICPGERPCPRGPVCIGSACTLAAPDFVFDERLTTWQYAALFTWDVTRSSLRPYVGASVGGVTHVGLDETGSDARLGPVVGLKVGAGAVRARLELGDLFTPSHFLTGRDEHDVQVRVGVAVRIP